MHRALLYVVALASILAFVASYNNGHGATPPMGWNTVTEMFILLSQSESGAQTTCVEH